MLLNLLFFLKFLLLNKVSAGWKDELNLINYSANLPDTTINQIILNLLNYLLAIFTILSVISFVIYGIMFLFGGTNKVSADSARKGVQYSIIGLIIGLSGYIIIRFIGEMLSGYFSLYF